MRAILLRWRCYAWDLADLLALVAIMLVVLLCF